MLGSFSKSNDVMTTSATKSIIEVRDFTIPSESPGIELHLRNKRITGGTAIEAAKTIVLVHGASVSSRVIFDLPLGGISFLDFLALQGFDVFTVDVRGYGGSTRPPEMDEDATHNAPIVSTSTALSDFSSAVNHVLESTGHSAVNLFGMSWGATIAGAFAAANPSKTLKLGLVAPQWLSDVPVPIDPGGPLGAYRVIPVGKLGANWLKAAPAVKRSALVREDWVQMVVEAILADEPSSVFRDQGFARAPSGAIQDIRDYWTSGRPFYDPSAIVAPILLVHAEWDIDAPWEITRHLFSAFTSAAYKQWVEIGEGTHLVLLEKNRLLAFRAVAQFFSLPFRSEQ
jgi:pimeloyl-ACP methyl ester carboxylesterase